MDTLQSYLETPVDWEKINELGHEVFYEGHLDKMDDLLLVILPIVNMVYYKYLLNLDDRGYAKEELIQDSILEIYRDISLRWDKFIYVEDYYSYFKVICKNVMLTLVHQHHSYYLNSEYDPEVLTSSSEDYRYSVVEAKIMKDYFYESMLTMTRKLASKRVGYTKALDYLITWKLVEGNTDTNKLKSMMRILGITRSTVNFLLDHITYLYRFSFNYYKTLEKGEVKMSRRLDNILDRYNDETYSVLSKNYGDSIIPEIYAEFGPDLTKKFIKVFSGRQIDVPDYTNFCDDILGCKLLSLVDSREELYELASNYKLDYSTLSRIYTRAIKNRENLK